MTNEEAIEVLEGFTTNPLFSRKHCEALNMAIKSLKREKEREAKELAERDKMLDDYYNTPYTARNIL